MDAEALSRLGLQVKPKNVGQTMNGGLVEQHREEDAAEQQGQSPAQDDGASKKDSLAGRLGPGFAWGLATGTFGLVALFVIGIVIIGVTQMLTFGRTVSSGGDRVEISPVNAGKDWFSVETSGHGTLKGWTNGASGTGSGWEIDGAVGYIDVGALGLLDGVKVMHSVSVYVTDDTRIFDGDKPYPKGEFDSAAEAVMDDNGDFTGDVIGDRPVTVEFHRDGQDVVADTIRISTERGENPLY